MERIKKTICMLSMLAVCIFAHAEAAPDWIKETGYKSLKYSYLVVRSADAASPESAETLALGKIKAEADGNLFTVIDTYKEKKRDLWRVYVLAQISRMTGYNVGERLEKTNNYKLIGESFIPGMAQIKKGQIAKGVSFIAAEIVCVGGVIIGENQRSSLMSKIQETRNPDIKKRYKNDADKWATARNIFIAGTAAVYVWNVIDGIVAKGKTQILGPNGERVAFSPYYNPSSSITPESYGLALSITW